MTLLTPLVRWQDDLQNSAPGPLSAAQMSLDRGGDEEEDEEEEEVRDERVGGAPPRDEAAPPEEEEGSPMRPRALNPEVEAEVNEEDGARAAPLLASLPLPRSPRCGWTRPRPACHPPWQMRRRAASAAQTAA